MCRCMYTCIEKTLRPFQLLVERVGRGGRPLTFPMSLDLVAEELVEITSRRGVGGEAG